MTQEFALHQGRTTIGRASTNDLAIPADLRVGRRHASIVEETGHHIIHDMDSANGTWVNDVRVSRQILEPGDRIRVGGTTLVYTGRALQLPASVPLPASPATSGSGLAIAAAIGAVALVAMLSSSPGSGQPYGGTPTATPRPSAGQAVATVVADMDRHLCDSGYVAPHHLHRLSEARPSHAPHARGPAGRGRERVPRRFDLMIVDEAHNVAPSGSGRYALDSLRTQAIRSLVPHFEHRLFLTTTPHNGYAESFSALLELLDSLRLGRQEFSIARYRGFRILAEPGS